MVSIFLSETLEGGTFNKELVRFIVSPAAFGGVALTAGFLVAMASNNFLLNVRERNPPTLC